MFLDKIFGKKEEMAEAKKPPVAIPSGKRLSGKVDDLVDEIESLPVKAKRPQKGPNILVADNKGEYIPIDDYRDRDRNISSENVAKIRQEIKIKMREKEAVQKNPAPSAPSKIEAPVEKRKAAAEQRKSPVAKSKSRSAKLAELDKEIKVLDEKISAVDSLSNQELADSINNKPQFGRRPQKVEISYAPKDPELEKERAYQKWQRESAVKKDSSRFYVPESEEIKEPVVEEQVGDKKEPVIEGIVQEEEEIAARIAEEVERLRLEDERKKQEEENKKMRHLDPDKVPNHPKSVKPKIMSEADIDAEIAAFHDEFERQRKEKSGSPEAKAESSTAEKSFKEVFDLNPEDLEGIEGFNDLSEGQKLFVLENLRQITLGKVKEGGELEYEKKTSAIMKGENSFGKTPSWLKRNIPTFLKAGALAMNNLTKSFKIASSEKRLVEELMKGGIKEHGEVLRLLVEGMKDGPEVLEKDGRPEIQFASLERWHGEDEKKIAENFNASAAAFMRLPKEWNYDNATAEQKKRYEEAELSYREAKEEYLALEAAWFGEKWACQDLNSIDAKIAINQLLNQNPEAEEELIKISGQNELWRGAVNSLKASRGRGISMSAGFAIRGLAVSAVGAAGSFIAAPLVGGAIGAWRGREKAKKDIEKQDKKARIGSGEADEKAANFVPAVHLVKRLKNLADEYQAAVDKGDVAKAGQLMMSLKTRIDYTEEKINGGLVDFGTKLDYSELSKGEQAATSSEDERRGGVLGQQFELVQELCQAKALAVKINLKAEDEALRERLDSWLENNEEKIDASRQEYVKKKMISGALMCAGFALAGAAARDVAGDWFGWNKTGSVLKKGLGGAREALKDLNTVSAVQASPSNFSQINVGLPAAAAIAQENPVEPQVFSEAIVTPSSSAPSPESLPYWGGKSVWNEAENQLRALKGAASLEEVAKVKNLIVAEPEKYGLAADVDFNKMGADQIKGINWDEALKDFESGKDSTQAVLAMEKAAAAGKTEGSWTYNVDKSGNLNLSEEFKNTLSPDSKPEVLADLDRILKRDDAVVPMNKIHDLPSSEEITAAVGSPEHIDAFVQDGESQKLLSLLSQKSKLIFDPKAKIPKGQIYEEVSRLKAPIERELGGQVSFDPDGTVRIKTPGGYYRNLYSPENSSAPSSQVVEEAPSVQKTIVSQANARESGAGGAKVENVAFIRGYGQQDGLNKEIYEKLSLSDRRALETTSRSIRALSNSLKNIPPESGEAKAVQKTIKGIMSNAENKFGQGVFNDEIKGLAGIKAGVADNAFVEPSLSAEKALGGTREALKETAADNPPVVEKTLVVDSEAFKVLDKNPLADFPQKKLVFAGNLPSAYQAKLEAYFQSSLAERDEIIKQLGEWRDRYGDRPQYASFEKMVRQGVSNYNKELKGAAMAASGQGKIEFSVFGQRDPAKVADDFLDARSSLSKLVTTREVSDDIFSEADEAFAARKGVRQLSVGTKVVEAKDAPLPSPAPEVKNLDFADSLEEHPAAGEIARESEQVELKSSINTDKADAAMVEMEKEHAAVSKKLKDSIVSEEEIVKATPKIKVTAVPAQPEPQNFKPLENTLFNGGKEAAKEAVGEPSSGEAITMTLQEAKSFDQPITEAALAKSLAGQGAYIDLRKVPSVSAEALKAWQGENKVFNLWGLRPESLNRESALILKSFKGRIMVPSDVLERIEELSS